jgi:phthalate 4,5-cis-dihydrodiol dehydrogenase
VPEVGIGIIGLGRATALLLPAITAFPGYRVVAVAEPRDELRSTFCADFAVRGYPDAAELCADGEVDLVYVASPHQFHGGCPEFRRTSVAAR